MSKEIFLYSADNKYQAYVELADNTDRFGCPDHSFFKLIENRNDDKLYLIAEARDGLLETEKDQRIAELEQELAELKEKAIVPKFKGSSIVYSIAFKEIEKVQVIAYLNRCIILCRNLKTRELHTIHCDYLFETEQEAQAKLKEMKGNG